MHTFSHTRHLDAERSLLAKCSTVFSSHAGSAILSVAAAVCLTQEGLGQANELDALNAAPGQRVDVRELKAHSRSKSPVKKIAKAMKRTVGALRQKALSLGLPLGPSPVSRGFRSSPSVMITVPFNARRSLY